MTVLYFLGLSILQNGKLPQFLGEQFIQEIFNSAHPSPCMLSLHHGLAELGIYQVR